MHHPLHHSSIPLHHSIHYHCIIQKRRGGEERGTWIEEAWGGGGRRLLGEDDGAGLGRTIAASLVAEASGLTVLLTPRGGGRGGRRLDGALDAGIGLDGVEKRPAAVRISLAVEEAVAASAPEEAVAASVETGEEASATEAGRCGREKTAAARARWRRGGEKGRGGEEATAARARWSSGKKAARARWRRGSGGEGEVELGEEGGKGEVERRRAAQIWGCRRRGELVGGADSRGRRRGGAADGWGGGEEAAVRGRRRGG
ncbi:hypothetical protein [Oryza sativa Japonica Group]|uniref:Uncharacterized protein n=1 Tax=Oryza sativa subsp. japonica TaxID=39947 RepID=Q5ZAS6_ORYSJ|nr:hypothetical protein [Oryza sativa Japonica Group]